MGYVICVSPWLHDLSLRGAPYTKPAHQIMRAQILVRRRRGHVLQLDTEYVRRAIAHAAKHGRVAAVMVECVECRWQAWLSDWVKSCDLSNEKIAAILADQRGTRGAMMCAYLRQCMGSALAAELAASEHAPAEEGS